MNETRDLLERVGDRFAFPAAAFERLEHRRDRKRRNQRIAAGIVGVAVAVAVAIGGANLVLSSPTVPATPNGDLPPILREGEVLIQSFHGGQLEAIDPSTGDRRTILDCEPVSTHAEDVCGRIGDPAYRPMADGSPIPSFVALFPARPRPGSG